MRIVFDATCLGMACRNAGWRTGVFRVADRVVRGLAHSPECVLTLYAGQEPNGLHDYVTSLASSDGLRGAPILYPRSTRLAGFIGRHTNTGTGSFREVVTSRDPHVWARDLRLGSRIRRRALQHGLGLVENCLRAVEDRSLDSVDIFHSPAFAIPEKARRRAKLRKFTTVHDLTPTLYPQYFPSAWIGPWENALRSISHDDWVLCVSHSTRNDLCDVLNLDAARIFVTHLAADEELFYPCSCPEQLAAVRARYGIPDGPYVLSVSTLEPRKNMSHLVKCFARMCDEQHLRDLSLVLVGGKGWLNDALFQAISESRSVRDRIIVTGYVPDTDLAPFYSGALAFVYPSVYEGFGLPVLEAMQCGAPVVTSNTSSLPEVVGEAGIMVDPADADALCAAMYELYSDPCLREDLAHRSVERAGQFSWDKCVQETLHAYRTSL